MTNKPTYSLTDDRRAALLLTLGIPMVDAVPHSRNPKQLCFVFDDTDGRARLAGGAIAQNREVPIGSYLEAWRKCRELIFQFKQTREDVR